MYVTCPSECAIIKTKFICYLFLCNFDGQTDFLNDSCLSGPCFFGPGYPPSKPEDLLDVLPAEATCLTAFAEAAEVEEALKSLEL